MNGKGNVVIKVTQLRLKDLKESWIQNQMYRTSTSTMSSRTKKYHSLHRRNIKFGKSIQTYVVIDKEQNSYILGLREVFNKSGQSTQDTLKEILRDINLHCHVIERKNLMNPMYTILASIRDTMPDRASKEKVFNNLLEEYRSTILPNVIQITGRTLMKQKRNDAPN